MHAGWVSLLKINPDRPCQDCRGSPQEAWLKLLSKGFKALKSFIPSHSIWKVSQICKCNFRNPKWDSFDASDTLVAFQSSSINVDQQKLSENWTEFAWNIWGYSRRNRGERNLFDQTAISHLLKMSLKTKIFLTKEANHWIFNCSSDLLFTFDTWTMFSYITFTSKEYTSNLSHPDIIVNKTHFLHLGLHMKFLFFFLLQYVLTIWVEYGQKCQGYIYAWTPQTSFTQQNNSKVDSQMRLSYLIILIIVVI